MASDTNSGTLAGASSEITRVNISTYFLHQVQNFLNFRGFGEGFMGMGRVFGNAKRETENYVSKQSHINSLKSKYVKISIAVSRF